MKSKNKGFSIIELIFIVAIIAILATIILSIWTVRANKKAAVVSFKTTMNNLKNSLELCKIGGGTLSSGDQGDDVCDPGIGSIYPMLPLKCGIQPIFYVSNVDPWLLTTVDPANPTPPNFWDCYGCRLVCQTDSCSYAENEPGDCF